jgi:peptidoglycan hydrolase CwlO-like protein
VGAEKPIKSLLDEIGEVQDQIGENKDGAAEIQQEPKDPPVVEISP